MAEGQGFEPWGPFGGTAFREQHHRPLGQPSKIVTGFRVRQPPGYLELEFSIRSNVVLQVIVNRLLRKQFFRSIINKFLDYFQAFVVQIIAWMLFEFKLQ